MNKNLNIEDNAKILKLSYIKKYYKQGAAFSSARKRRECAFGRALF